MEKIFDLKFIVPPILAILFVFITDPIRYLSRVDNPYDALLSATIILAFGFLISTIANSIVNISHKRDTLKECLEKKGVKTKNESEREFISWKAESQYSKEDNGFIESQISKRWGMAIANFNCAISLCLIIILAFIFNGKLFFPIDWWWILTISFFCLFSLNSFLLYKSVKELDVILYKKMKNNTIINVSEIEKLFKEFCEENKIEFLENKFEEFLKFLKIDFYDWVKGNLSQFNKQ